MNYKDGRIYKVFTYNLREHTKITKDKDLDSLSLLMEQYSRYLYKQQGQFDNDEQVKNGIGKFTYPSGEKYHVNT